jgi:hypothetical protein
MPAFFNRECPHCGHQTTFQIFGSYLEQAATFALGRCMGCHLPVVAGFAQQIQLQGIEGNLERYGAHVLRSWPQAPAPVRPEHTPDRPRNLYLQGIDNQRRGNWDAAGMAFRTCLDQALRRLHPEGNGTLYNRINTLPVETGVTPSMRAWAHEIRALGNEAAHEDEPFDEDTAGDLQKFTEVFLMYAFTLPGMLAARHPEDGAGAQ